MEFWATIVGLIRRRAVLIPALLIAGTLGAVAYLLTPVSYVSSTTMVLTTTQYGGTESLDPSRPTDLTNPLLNFNDSLTTTSAILIEGMNNTSVDDQLNATGSTKLVVDDGRSNPDLLGLDGPFLYIVGRSTSPIEARRVVIEAQSLMRSKLQEWQRAMNAPEKTYVTLANVVPPSAPVPGHGRAIKYGVLAFLFGFGAFLTVAYLRARRSTRVDTDREVLAGTTVDDHEAPASASASASASAPAPALASPGAMATTPATGTDPSVDPPDAAPVVPAPEVNPARVPTGRRSNPSVLLRSKNQKAQPPHMPVPVKRKARSRHP